MKERGNFTYGNETAKKFGVHEILLTIDKEVPDPFDVSCSVVFKAVSSGQTVTVNAFYDGGSTWLARLYVNEEGEWRWGSCCPEVSGLDARSGKFTATGSNLRGMLKRHPENPKHWVTDDGRWFLNISDTAYLLFNESEEMWQKYIEDLAACGITSVRAGSLGGEAWDEDSLKAFTDTYPGLRIDNIPWQKNDMRSMNLERFRITDERLKWMLDNYPDIYIQVILFGMKTWGADDTGPLWKAIPEEIRKNTMKYMLARWAAFPQFFWLVVNDMHCSEDFPNNREYAREIGRYFVQNDPWHHLTSTGPNRFAQFPFTSPQDADWISYIHIEDSYSLAAEVIEKYRDCPLHVFLGEDRYEHSKLDRLEYRISDPDYYYRRMFWSWILSGGSANYGGRWAKLHPYSLTATLEYIEPFGKVKYTEKLKGLDSTKHIKDFFGSRCISISEFVPDSLFVEDAGYWENGHIKVMRKGNEEFVIYHPNALDKDKGAVPDPDNTVSMRLNLKGMDEAFLAEWYCPADGSSVMEEIKGGGFVKLTAPWKGKDAVLYLKKMDKQKANIE